MTESPDSARDRASTKPAPAGLPPWLWIGGVVLLVLATIRLLLAR